MYLPGVHHACVVSVGSYLISQISRAADATYKRDLPNHDSNVDLLYPYLLRLRSPDNSSSTAYEAIGAICGATPRLPIPPAGKPSLDSISKNHLTLSTLKQIRGGCTCHFLLAERVIFITLILPETKGLSHLIRSASEFKEAGVSCQVDQPQSTPVLLPNCCHFWACSLLGTHSLSPLSSLTHGPDAVNPQRQDLDKKKPGRSRATKYFMKG